VHEINLVVVQYKTILFLFRQDPSSPYYSKQDNNSSSNYK